MRHPPRFALLPADGPLIHEEIRPDAVGLLVERIRRDGRVEVPILVASDHWVILDGHHRFSALRALGARRVPAWIVDYDDPTIHLDRWDPGPPIEKREVVERAVHGRPFPPKTTRHRLETDMPLRATDLEELTREE